MKLLLSGDGLIEWELRKMGLQIWISVVFFSWKLDTVEATCISPPAVIDGTYSPMKDNFSATDTVTYACNTGYRKTAGDLVLTCNTTDNWVGIAPTCTRDSCQPGLFRCGGADCIKSYLVCNGEVNCDDESDELNCTIACENKASFHCDNNKTECVPYPVVCDGRPNCNNGFDEEACDTEIMDLCLKDSKEATTMSGVGKFSKKSCFVVAPGGKCRSSKAEELSIGNEHTQQIVVHYLNTHVPIVQAGWIVVNMYLGLRVKTGNFSHADYIWDDGSPLTYTNWEFPIPSFFREDIVMKVKNNEWKWGRMDSKDLPAIITVCVFTQPGNKTNMLPEIPDEIMPVDKYMYFECNSGEFILALYVCDTVNDCFDNSDEINCDSRIGMYACDNGAQVYIGLWCDMNFDCQDRSDETNCVVVKCTTSEWRCDNGQCVTLDRLCDNTFDCNDGSDEGCKACGGSCIYKELYSCEESSQKCISRSLAADAMYECGNHGDDPPPINQLITICNQTNMKPAYIHIGEELYGTLTGYCSEGKFNTHTNDLTEQYDERENMTLVTFIPESNYLVDSLYNISATCRLQGAIFCDTGQYDSITCQRIRQSGPLQLSWKLRGRYIIAKGSYLTIECEPPFTINDEPTMMCKTGRTKMFARHKCLLNIKPDGAPYGCRDLTHLDNCEDFTCPPNYVKCPDSFCIHVRLVCDGQPHCPQSEDEIDCEIYSCRGMFSCRGSGSCLPHDLVCDGVRQCPHGDDERLCGFECPPQCKCNGVAFLRCNATFPLFTNATRTSKYVRYLDLSNSVVSSSRFSELSVFQSLIVLNISRCDIKTITSNLPNPLLFIKGLEILDLSHNMLELVTKTDFSGLYLLKKLVLTGNINLVAIDSGAFNDLKRLTHLHIAHCGINTIDSNTFQGMISVEYLYINSNPMHIQAEMFKELSSLSYLDIRGVTVELKNELFSGIDNLKKLYTDSFSLCCVMKTVYFDGVCIAPENAISSCENLIKNDLLRICIWIIGASAMLGNVFVIGYHIRHGLRIRKWQSFTVSVTFLSVSDLLMGIYTLIIASVDVYFRGIYSIHEMQWRASILCTSAGILSTISCEASAMLVCLIAVDRYVAIRYPFSKLSATQSLIFAMLAQIIAVVIAVIPITMDFYFGGEFYSSSGACIALPLTGSRTKGWQYSVCVFIVFNMILFVAVGTVQGLLYKEVKASNVQSSRNQREVDAAVARSLSVIIITNFCCWFPICVLGFMSLGGFALSLEIYAWIIVFVLPINAALNPFLYTISAIRKKKKYVKGITGTSDAVTTNAFLQIYNDITREGNLKPVDATNQSSMLLSRFLANNSMSTQGVQLIKRRLLEDIDKFRGRNICHGYISEDTVSVIIEENDIIDAHLIFQHKRVTEHMNSDKDVADVNAMIVRLKQSTPSVTDGITMETVIDSYM